MRGTTAVLILLVAAAAVAACEASVYNQPISRAEVVRRGQEWVRQRVAYNNYAKHPGAFNTKPYRMDCSGFVSMCWKLSSDPNTAAMRRAAPCTRIPWDQIKAGDAVLREPPRPGVFGHVSIFLRWTNGGERYEVVEEAGTSKGTVQQTRNFARDRDRGAFACKYNRITGDAPSDMRAPAPAAATAAGTGAAPASSPAGRSPGTSTYTPGAAPAAAAAGHSTTPFASSSGNPYFGFNRPHAPPKDQPVPEQPAQTAPYSGPQYPYSRPLAADVAHGPSKHETTTPEQVWGLPLVPEEEDPEKPTFGGLYP